MQQRMSTILMTIGWDCGSRPPRRSKGGSRRVVYREREKEKEEEKKGSFFASCTLSLPALENFWGCSWTLDGRD